MKEIYTIVCDYKIANRIKIQNFVFQNSKEEAEKVKEYLVEKERPIKKCGVVPVILYESFEEFKEDYENNREEML